MAKQQSESTGRESIKPEEDAQSPFGYLTISANDEETLWKIISSSFGDLLQFLLKTHQSQDSAPIKHVRDHIADIVTRFDEAIKEGDTFYYYRWPAKALVRRLAQQVPKMDKTYPFLADWAKSDVNKAEHKMKLQTHKWSEQRKRAYVALAKAISINLLLMAKTTFQVGNSQINKEIEMCYDFQLGLRSRWEFAMFRLSKNCQEAMTMQPPKPNGGTQIYLSEMFKSNCQIWIDMNESRGLLVRNASPALQSPHSFTVGKNALATKPQPAQSSGGGSQAPKNQVVKSQPPTSHSHPIAPAKAKSPPTWYITGSELLAQRFVKTMETNEWGPETTPSLGLRCGAYALSQSIAAVDHCASEPVFKAIMKGVSSASEANFDIQDLTKLLKKVRPNYILAIAARKHGRPDNLNVYSVFAYGVTLFTNEAAVKRPIIWISNNNLNLPDALNHWESFGPKAYVTPKYEQGMPQGFIADKIVAPKATPQEMAKYNREINAMPQEQWTAGSTADSPYDLTK